MYFVYTSVFIMWNKIVSYLITTFSGRWDDMGPEMYKFKDRNGIDHCLSPVCVMLSILLYIYNLYYL